MKRINRFIKPVVLLSVIMLMITLLAGCENDYNKESGDGLFAIIKRDKSGTLATDSTCYHYYYLKDTGIVYAGYISPYGVGQTDSIAPVISEKGNYYRYNREERQVEEVARETKDKETGIKGNE